MNFYIVIYGDYDIPYNIKGVFTDKSKAEKCKEYELKRIGKKEYGETVEIVVTKCSDDEDFDAKIFELEEKKRQKWQKTEDEIKAFEMSEFNRIKEKYNLKIY